MSRRECIHAFRLGIVFTGCTLNGNMLDKTVGRLAVPRPTVYLIFSYHNHIDKGSTRAIRLSAFLLEKYEIAWYNAAAWWCAWFRERWVCCPAPVFDCDSFHAREEYGKNINFSHWTCKFGWSGLNSISSVYRIFVGNGFIRSETWVNIRGSLVGNGF